jgi:hypothetical protein
METESNWKFTQCFGEKGDASEVSEGITSAIIVFIHSLTF